MQETISKKNLREFGILMGFTLPILIGWLLPAVAGYGFRKWTLWIGIPGLILGLTAPRLLHYPYKGWMALGHALGWVNSRLILGLIYIIVLLPTAYLMRLTGYDPLSRQRKGKNTYKQYRKSYHTDLSRIF